MEGADGPGAFSADGPSVFRHAAGFDLSSVAIAVSWGRRSAANESRSRGGAILE